MKDEALEQVWRNRKAMTKKCNNDPHKLVKYLQQREKKRKDKQNISPS